MPHLPFDLDLTPAAEAKRVFAAAVAGRISVVQADITRLDVDAIVNAANPTLLGGGGVDGAIHRAAGPGLLAECRALGGCPTGEARLTRGHRLPARHVIHTVGPVWRGGGAGEAALLAAAYRACLELAREHRLDSIAFPAIATGVYAFPGDEACAIAVREVLAALAAGPLPARVVFCCFSEEDRARYERELATQRGTP
jgi:O-acetyl-ADP-ribose deacetylase (regulator of RNase III)